MALPGRDREAHAREAATGRQSDSRPLDKVLQQANAQPGRGKQSYSGVEFPQMTAWPGTPSKGGLYRG